MLLAVDVGNTNIVFAVFDDDGNLSTENLASVEVDDLERYLIKSGDLLLARTGTVGSSMIAGAKIATLSRTSIRRPKDM